MSNTDTERETSLTPQVRFDDRGLVPAIVQDIDTGCVLMMGWMNARALEQTLSTRRATFYSRSRDKIWVKGESSGHIQEVVEARIDCDQDTVLLRCKSHGPCCHAGYDSCFYRGWTDDPQHLRFIEDKVFDPSKVYQQP